MISEKMGKALNEQLKWELYSGYLYLSMATYFKDRGLDGFARWMEVQALEELSHAMKFYSYLNERGFKVDLQPIDGPPTTWDSPVAVFEHVLEHEQHVTKRIHDLVDLAIEERDHGTNNFLQWFVGEQVEEEASAAEVLNKVKLVQDGGGLYLLDRELGQRLFNVPPDVTILNTGAK
ncbi:ferritin [Thermodesulforhabdus norvegica]|uniref:Ferritin n=1 Tax=Thermodesulforhabdus norvegica TaxID=39841 RepID=A0A1I4V0Y6_9BACT|nr:ferritin [Thermodesulforhabdus norvegica]SFM94884.1 ferritin [Thermodesulforhabdus norvegica]